MALNMKKPGVFITSCLALGLSLLPSQADLLVYEGFKGYDPEKTLVEMGPNDQTVGLVVSSTYGTASFPPNKMTPGPGLALSNLKVSGGALHYAGGVAQIAGAGITTTTDSPIIWGSYLVQLSTVSTGNGSGHEVRLNRGGAGYFRVAGDSRGSGAGFDRPSVSYTNSGSQVAPNPLAAGTTYIVISSLDSSPEGTGARLWVLDRSAFINFVAGGREESFLADPANVYGSATAPYAAGGRGWHTEDMPGMVEILIQNGSGQTTIMDEIRFGETLHDVTPLAPEPQPGELAMTSNFENGNGDLLEIDSESGRVVFSPWRVRESRNVWWYIQLSGVKENQEIELVAEGVDSLGGNAHPVYSYDRQTWYRMNDRQSPYRQTFRAGNVWIARNIPYTYTDSITLTDQMVGREHVTVHELCVSEGGNSVRMLKFTDASVSDAGKEIIWVQARQHAFESHSSHVAESLAWWMISAEAAELRRRAVVYIVPVMDVDSVKEGAAGKDQKPVDFNRSWVDGSHWTAVRSATALLDGVTDQGGQGLLAFIDIHSPYFGDVNHWYEPDPGVLLDNARAFAALYGDTVTGMGGANHWARDAIIPVSTPATMARNYAADRWMGDGERGLVLLMEVSNLKDGRRRDEGAFINKEGLQDYGKAMGMSLSQWALAGGGDSPPEFGEIPVALWTKGQNHNLVVTASDLDGDPVILSANFGSVPGATFVDLGDGSGRLSWDISSAVAPGIYLFPISATVNDVTVSANIRVRVIDDNPYWTWVKNTFVDLSPDFDLDLVSMDQDPDMDGISNVHEMAFLTDPQSSDRPKLEISVERGSPQSLIRLKTIRRTGSSALVDLSPEMNVNLSGEWIPVPTSGWTTEIDRDGDHDGRPETETVEFLMYGNLIDKVFYRLRSTLRN